MNLVSNVATTRLAHRGILALRDRVGDRIDCRGGSVWITQEGDPRDLVLDAGESVTLDRAGTAIVEALTDAAVAVQRAAPSALHTGTDAVRWLRRGALLEGASSLWAVRQRLSAWMLAVSDASGLRASGRDVPVPAGRTNGQRSRTLGQRPDTSAATCGRSGRHDRRADRTLPCPERDSFTTAPG